MSVTMRATITSSMIDSETVRKLSETESGAMSTTSPPDPCALPPGVVDGWIADVIRDVVQRLEPPRRRFAWGRPAMLPAFLVWGTLLVGVLHAITRQREMWRRLALAGGLDERPVLISDQGLSHRLVRAGVAPRERLFGAGSQVRAERLEPWRAR